MDMRISSVFKAYDAYQVVKPASSARTSRAEVKKDMVALSEEAKDFQTIYKTLANTPDVREQLVNDIKSRMEKGTYFVSDTDLANKIMKGI